jgi:hypothetical protein
MYRTIDQLPAYEQVLNKSRGLNGFSKESIRILHAVILIVWASILKFFCRIPLGPPNLKKRSNVR